MMNFSTEEYKKHIELKSFHKRMAYADAQTIIESGLYFTQIKRFKEVFTENQLLILDYDEIKNTEQLTRKLSEFLNIKLIKPTSNSEKVNKAIPHRKYSHRLSKFFPKGMKRLIKNLFFQKPKLKKKSRKLLKRFYAIENRQLYEEFKLDFVKKWL